MKKLLIPVILILCVCMLMGCSDSAEKECRIELEGNATTGYEWVYTANPEGIVKEISSEYVPADSDGETAGSGGLFVFLFEGVKEGTTTLEFSYVREWEEEENPQTERYTITVDGNGAITDVEKEDAE